MKQLTNFLKSMVVGGLVVILPLAILLFVMNWLFGKVRDLIRPLTAIVMEWIPFSGVTADAIVIVLLVLVCVTVGALVRTKVGGWLHHWIESRFLLKAPGYSLIKEILMQFMGAKRSPFSTVVLAQVFGNETLCTGFVMDEDAQGEYVTVFVPTGPNPTSGWIFHLPQQFVHQVKVPIEETMRTIIGCGAGSSVLLNARGQAVLHAGGSGTGGCG